MSIKNTGGPAFPVTEDNGANFGDVGMSLRDYFAAKAMQGWLANATSTPVEAGVDSASPKDLADVAAIFGYMVADAMLKEREA